MNKRLLYIIYICLFITNIGLTQISVSIPDTTLVPDKSIKIPIFVSELTGNYIRSYSFRLVYDQKILKFKSISDKGTLSDRRSWDIDADLESEGLVINADGRYNLYGSGKLLIIKFDVIADEGYTDLIIESFKFNSGSPSIYLNNGSFRVYVEKKFYFSNKGNGKGEVSINGENFVLPFEKVFVQGKSYTLKAEPNYSSRFVSWSGDISSTQNPLELVVENSMEIISNFSLKTHSISAMVLPEGFGQVNGVGVYNYGDIAILEALPNSGKGFVNWTINEVIVSDNISYQINVNKDIDITANFENTLFQVTTSNNPVEAGQTTGAGYYFPNQTANVVAISNHNWIFLNWTENGEIISEDSIFIFDVTDNKSLTANYDVLTDLRNVDEIIPTESNSFILSPYPNPFNPTTTFSFGVENQSRITLIILDITGKIVEKLYQSELFSKGVFEKSFNASSLASGVYFYQFKAIPTNKHDNIFKTGKLILMK
jgi:Secretion system C-terminal sorting domain/Divergent InlB B-repeat domain/Cohesin domain